jgi:hypothetical protein
VPNQALSFLIEKAVAQAGETNDTLKGAVCPVTRHDNHKNNKKNNNNKISSVAPLTIQNKY